MVDKTNGFKMSGSKVKQAQIKKVLAKKIPVRVNQYDINTVSICKQKINEFGIEN